MKERIVTAICLLAVVIPVVMLGGYWFLGLGLMVTVIAAWEMMNLHDHLNKTTTLVKCLTIVATVSVIVVSDVMWAFKAAASYVVLILLIEAMFSPLKKGGVGLYVLTVCYIGFSFRALLEIRQHGLILFIFLIVLVVLTDSAAYFTGRVWGKHQLAPKISPKKTVEGAIGGWVAGAGFATLFGLANHLFTEMWVLTVLAVSLPILSQIGDLIASALKRRYGIKDYGKIFPGHGGVMDRVDSQMLAGLLLYVIIQIGGVGS